jgi:hypothetical protein
VAAATERMAAIAGLTVLIVLDDSVRLNRAIIWFYGAGRCDRDTMHWVEKDAGRHETYASRGGSACRSVYRR